MWRAFKRLLQCFALPHLIRVKKKKDFPVRPGRGEEHKEHSVHRGQISHIRRDSGIIWTTLPFGRGGTESQASERVVPLVLLTLLPKGHRFPIVQKMVCCQIGNAKWIEKGTGLGEASWQRDVRKCLHPRGHESCWRLQSLLSRAC